MPWGGGYDTGIAISYASTMVQEPVYVPPPCPATLPQAWGTLAAGETSAAFEAFACLADRAPDDGSALVGLSLSSALRDQDDEAVAAMRHALQVDPEALDLVPADEQLVTLLAGLSARFEERARSHYGDVDALFMAASLCYLRHEIPAAHYAVEVAITLGDTDASALNLKALIER